MECVIVIPLHTSLLRSSELIAIDRCVGVWGEKYDITIITPLGLDFTELQECYPTLKFKGIAPDKMSSIKAYNRLLLSAEFYALFKEYDYMLIYQCDCFVFGDSLAHWLERGYDYVGAPWYFKLGVLGGIKKALGALLRALRLYHTDYFRWGEVGNGGLSLRKIESFLKHLQNSKGLTKRAAEGRLNEDVYWSMCARTLSKPNAEEASHFCGDMTPTICPDDVMSCHGWNKNSETLKFWRDRIENLGYKI